ncbi:hypothetical protein [Roseovarius pelagicus]|uniref:Lipoprotein n=1 Tax=Roseovarius pelagicus TaxID=2980108 RepID=A0ABY6DCU6_9RHOB|nr:MULTISPECIES: hypothetical protein [Rhodobacterales]UXX83962.1 hypothetical protein N7U68_04720 [Roseovarius pelagicus]
MSVIALTLLSGLAACQASDPEVSRFAPDYQGIETQLLDGDLVNFHVSMTGARNTDDVDRYAACAAAQYTLIRGYGFARHLRTNIVEEGGIWRGDAVYTISPALPRGLKTLDAEVVAADCAENGIPMV